MTRTLLCALAAGALAAAGCAGGEGSPDCEDGLDNDGDGFIDQQDPGCVFGDSEDFVPDNPACSDGVDNDDDGLIDLDDPGCAGPDDDDESNEPVPACQDGLDNDDDGLVDYPSDPGCFHPLDNHEDDDCPEGPGCPRCSNGVDDDEDGLTDYGEDPGCDTAADDDEYDPQPGECGGNVALLPLPSSGEAEGEAESGGNNELVSNGCGGTGQETVYTVNLEQRTALYVSTDFPETTLDTVVYVRSDCREIDSEVGCNDDAGGTASELLVEVDPGLYYIIVDAHSQLTDGTFKLEVIEYIPQGEVCDPEMPACAPDLVCRYFDDEATEPTCELPECSDGIDNDGDGIADYPDDPGCTGFTDNDEGDDCPDGAECPQCGNEVDDDGDGLIDFPDDPGCNDAADDSEIDECIAGVEVMPLVAGGVAGTTGGSGSFIGSCAFGDYPEDVYAFQLDRDLISLTFSTIGSDFDTLTHVRFDDCASSAAEIACEDPGTGGEDVTFTEPDQGTYFIFVDGAFGSGDYVLNATGVIAAGDSCDPADDEFVCEAGYHCEVDTCVPAACNDGEDNDGDGLTDYPDEPGCESISDNDETDDCPDGPGCPQCANEIDDDEDGFIDYPDDIGCNAAGDDDEVDCPGESDPVETMTSASASGTTVGLTDDFVPSCSTFSTAPDKVYVLNVTGELETLVVDTIGSDFDSMLYVKEAICSNPDIACDDQSGGNSNALVTLTDVAPGSYMLIVDGWSSYEGNYVLNVHGVIKGGESCDADQIDAGMMECASGYSCQAGVCEPAECNDGLDNDGDGLTDYPEDPGCASPSGNDETDDCPDGPGCPQCSNGIDDDEDGFIDYPDDIGCTAAGDDDEVDCPEESSDVQTMTEASVSGTTVGQGDDFAPSCSTFSTAPDVVWVLNVPGELSTLVVDTIGSDFDSMLYVKEEMCGNPDIACDDQSGGNNNALVTLDDVAPGSYMLIVDGWSSYEGNYVLNVDGVIKEGEPCDPDQVDAGMLTCDGGTDCTDSGSGYVCE